MKITMPDLDVSVSEIFELLDAMELATTDNYPARNVFHRDLRNEKLERRSLESTISITARDTEGRLIGFLKLLTDHSYMFYILDVMVHPHYRGQGVGRKLVDEAIRYGKENGFIKIFLTSLPDKVNYYKSFGFGEGMSPVLSLRGEDYVKR
ncbi:GNAT family N-acetyltransferase [Vibrio owensii]|uniref:GNAT family N-acetyltransferase n=1 Tax=Vibrio owensii TaxID=696485 RepID=UPI00289531D8|nr:putative Acetyltransferase family protein [Vibrio owensii]